MRIVRRQLAPLAGAIAGCGLVLGAAGHAQVTTISFQNGVSGYNGTFDRVISERGGTFERDGSTVATYFLDGFNSSNSSPDEQALMRFDSIIGTGAGRVPAGATILDAKLTVTTSAAGATQTSGPFGVAGLNQAFDSSTTYFGNFTSATNFGSRGTFWKDGYSTRPVGGYGFQIPGVVSGANVHSLVQSWVDGAPNHGFAIYAGMADSTAQVSNTDDGWSINATGHPVADVRPKLDVTYTTAPVTKRSFQRGVNGYTGDVMAIVRSGTNALIADTTDPTNPERTEDGLTLAQTFLDGVFFTQPNGATSSPDDLALLKFGGVFDAGQVPLDVPVAKAWLVLTTGDNNLNARTPGPFTAHAMLRPWDLSTLHSAFGAVNGLQVSDGDISPALDALHGFIDGSEQWFDVTAYLEGVRTGATDYGLAVQSGGTADGWQIHTNGSEVESARPRLVVYSADLGVSNPLGGDFDDNGVVNGADLMVWQRGVGASYGPADLAAWRANFGSSGGGPLIGPAAGAVPEPTSVVACLSAFAGAFGVARRRPPRA